MLRSNNKRKQRHKTLIVDDHAIVREGLASLINQETDLCVCGEAEDAETGQKLISEYEPDLVILDLSLKGGSGLVFLKQIRTFYEDLPVLVLSMHDELVYAERALKAGANGYIMKQEGTTNLILAIRTVLRGEIYMSEELRNILVNNYLMRNTHKPSLPIKLLTNRQFEVLQLIGHGYGTQEIARQLHISVKTVESHRMHIKEKLNLEKTTELVRFAIKWQQSDELN